MEKKEQLGSGKKYLNEMRISAGNAVATEQKGSPKGLSAAEQRALNKQREAEERRRARLLEKLEKEIADLEERSAEIERQLCSEENMNDYQFLAELSRQREEISDRLSAAYEEWAEAEENFT